MYHESALGSVRAHMQHESGIECTRMSGVHQGARECTCNMGQGSALHLGHGSALGWWECTWMVGVHLSLGSALVLHFRAMSIGN